MTDDPLVALDGSTFFVSDRTGDVVATEAEGFFHDDIRHLSMWRLLVDGSPLRVLTSRSPDYYSASIVGTLGSARVGENPTITVRRERFVGDGVHEDIIIENNSNTPRSVLVELRFGADFADIFEIKDRRHKQGRSGIETRGEQRVDLWYERGGFRRGTVLAFGTRGSISDDRASFELTLGARQSHCVCIDISCVVEGEQVPPSQRCGSFGRPKPKMPLSLDEWLDQAPTLDTDLDALRHTYRQSLVDLAALRFRPQRDLSWSLPAAGLPWFMALFGRDSLITAFQALPFQPTLARTTLEVLASLQSRSDDAFRDAEPGKILHELRRGELATLGEWPHSPYYGSHDATPLFLILLDEYEHWTADAEFVRKLEPAARAAITWIETFGDLDGDGYLEYQRRSPKGLDNQCWKDSWNSIAFADGRLAAPPIAACEIQGYAYDARRRAARLARRVWGDAELASRLEADAAALRDRFDRDFWNEEHGCYALALDGDKRQVDSVTSNVGHLLWSGIVPAERAETIAERLMASDMWSGWGIRTMSASAAAYNPIEYHNGTVWPHDTAIVAEGLRRYGLREQASTLVVALVEAAEAFAYRLPEVFAGFAKENTRMPVEYPTASCPQAWAAGAPLLGLRTLLGLDVADDELHVQQHLPADIGHLRLRGLRVRGRSLDAG